MKLSVFVVTYNQEKYIAQCLDGILMQEVDFEYEVIVGDDRSTDGTRRICENYADKYTQIKLLPEQPNMGIAKNWKRVLLACTGEYVAMCEGDDYWIDSRKLQKQVDLLDDNKEVGYVFTKNLILTDDNKIHSKEGLFERVPSIMDIHTLTNLWLPSHTQTVCFRRSLLPNEYPQEMESSNYVCDVYLKYLVGSKCKIAYINEATAVYRLGGVTGTQRDLESYIKSRREQLLKLDKLTNHEFSYFLVKQWKIHDCELLTLNYLNNKKKLKATKYFLLKYVYCLIYRPHQKDKNLSFLKTYIKCIMK